MPDILTHSQATEGVRLAPAPAMHRWSVRVHPEQRSALETLLELTLPTRPLRSFSGGSSNALWLGPDEWLVLMSPAEAESFRRRYESFDWSAAPPASVVEVTNRNVGIVLSGPRASWVLNAACPLDLSAQAFPPGACTRTLLGKAEIVLWRQERTEPAFHLECWRSYAPYVTALLERAVKFEGLLR